MLELVFRTHIRRRSAPAAARTGRHLAAVRGALLLLLLLLAGLAAAGCRQQARQAAPAAPASPGTPAEFRVLRNRAQPAQAHQRMLAELQEISDLTGDTIDWLGDAKARAARGELAALPATAPLPQQFLLRKDLAALELRLGNEQQAIDLLLHCHRLLEESDGQLDEASAQRLATELSFELGVAYMRLAETQNCCQRNSPDSCVVPLRGEGIHAQAHGSQEAVGWFERVLQDAPTDSQIWMRAVWLYNLAHMTLDRYPAGVPEPWRLPEAAFQTAGSFPEFRNVAGQKGLDTFSLAGGAIADDFNGDGRPDLVVSTYDTHGQMRYFANQGRGEFVDHTGPAGLTGLLGGLNLVHADYDNDGFLDILVLRGGWFREGGRHPNSLLHNNGDGTFTDVTFEAGMQTRAPTQTGSWADYDNDGDLDLYVGNETTRAVPIYSQLYRNNADGTFTDVAEQAGVLNNRFSKAVVWGDYDRDRLPDLYVSNFGEPNRLYRNQGDGSFVDVAPQLDVTGPLRSFPAWFWDFDNDGVLDIYVSSYADDIALLSATYLHAVHDAEAAALYRGDGKGGFQEVAQACALTLPTAPMGSNFGDLDNDGFLDFYLGTGEPEYRNLMPNVMYHNQGGQRFVDVTMAGRFGHLQKGHAVVFADLDQDGDQDVFQQLGGAYPGDRFFDALFENPGFDNHWISIKLVGSRSNRAALGARLHLRVREQDRSRSIYRHVNSGGSFGANPLDQFIGVGRAEAVELLEIFWPTSGETQQLRDLPVNQALRVVEDQAGYTQLPR